MIRKQSTDPVFDQVSVRLLESAHRNINQKSVFWKEKKKKETLNCDALSMLISYAALTL